MSDVTSFIARSVQGSGKAGRHWNRLGFGIGLLVIVAAGFVLLRILHDIDLDRVFEMIRSTARRDIALAACFVAVSYVTLTFYDYFSLRTLGHVHVPYRIAAMASFTSYAIGHNLGATVLTAGAVRWRIYSPWRLSAVDIAKMAFVTGLTFWLGNIVVLGLGMILIPDAAAAVDQLPSWANRVLGAFGLAAIACYLVWLWLREPVVGRGAWSIALPTVALTFVQIGIGLLDLTAGGLALYMLLPAAPSVDFVSVLVIYVTASLIGFLSHAPGSLGVFEAALLLALPQFPKEGLLASLLIFRCLYFVLPLLCAICIMAARECTAPRD